MERSSLLSKSTIIRSDVDHALTLSGSDVVCCTLFLAASISPTTNSAGHYHAHIFSSALSMSFVLYLKFTIDALIS